MSRARKDPPITTLSGRVERRDASSGSKSERSAVVLVGDGGQSHILRRRGGSSFADDVLDGLVGKLITLHGTVIDGLVLMDDWQEQSDQN